MEAKLAQLVEKFKAASGHNLKAVVLYGSAVTGEFHEKHSDLNILCIVESASVFELGRLHPAAEWWIEEGNRPPLIFTMDELVRSADIFAIELLDMKNHHRMLMGEDFFDQLDVPLQLHWLQVERELRQNWLRLRETILAAPRRKEIHLNIMLRSVPTFCALFRHALIALNQAAPHSKREAVDGIAAATGANPSGFQTILDLRAGKLKEKEVDVEVTLQTYLEFVEVVTSEVDRRLETSA